MMNLIHVYSCLILVLAVGGIHAQDDWELVFRAVEGIGDDPYALWTENRVQNEDDPDARLLTDEFKGHYKSQAAIYWQAGLLQVTEVKVSLYKSGEEVKKLEFDGRGSDPLSFMDKSRLTFSSWTDLNTATTTTTFGVDGVVVAGMVVRRFALLAPASPGGCENDLGWMAVVTSHPASATTGNCFWDEPRANFDFPFFIYSDPVSRVQWQGGNINTAMMLSADVAYADVFAIFVKHTNRATMIKCMDSCTVDESAGVIYIQVVVDFNFSPTSRRRRRRRSVDYTYPGVMADALKRSKRAGLFFTSAVVKTVKTATDSAEAFRDYGPVFFETEEFVTIPIAILDDDLVEGDETFTVEVAPIFPAGMFSSTETFSVIVTIQDNDVAPPPVIPNSVFTLDKSIYPVKESVGSAVVVKVKRTMDTSRRQDIVLSTSDVNTSPTDYEGQPTGVTLTFDTNADEKTHSFMIQDDEIVEGTEYFEMMLQAPIDGDLGFPYAATATITDDDYTHSLESRYICVREAVGTVRIHIIKRGFLGQVSSVNVRTVSDGTASSNEPGNDFNSVNTVVEFKVDQSAAYVDINIVKDGVFEDDEQFTVELSNSGPEEEISEPFTAIVVIKSDDLQCDPPCRNGGSCSGVNTCTCPTGYAGDVCETALRVVSGSLTIIESNGNGVVYSSALANPESGEYKTLELTVVTQLTKVLGSVPGFNKVIVVAFSEGSVIVEYNVLLDSATASNADTVTAAIRAPINSAGFLGDSSLKLDPASFIATDECPFEYCLNRGICSASGGRYLCACLDSFTGDRCESLKTDAAPTPAPTPAPLTEQPTNAASSSGLSDGNIAIIAVAIFIALLVGVIALTCYLWNFRRSSLCPKRGTRSNQPNPAAAVANNGYYGNNAAYYVDGSIQNPYSLQNPQSFNF